MGGAVTGEVRDAQGTDEEADVFVDHFDLDAENLGMERRGEGEEEHQREEG